MDELIDPNTLALITLVSLVVNAVTIYRWVSDYLNREALNDQAFHMLYGLAKSVSKRVSMIVKRTNLLKEQERENEESMIFLENMWGDSMSTIDNLLAAAKALKPRKAAELPYDATDMLQIAAARSNTRLHNNQIKKEPG